MGRKIATKASKRNLKVRANIRKNTRKNMMAGKKRMTAKKR